MRLIGIVGVVCLVAAPALATPVTYVFDGTAGAITLRAQEIGSTTGGLGGTFSVVVDDGPAIGDSDMVSLGEANLFNSSVLSMSLYGIATATVGTGSARILDFAQPAPAHLAGGSAACDTDVFVDATILVTGLFNTTLHSARWVGELLPMTVTLSDSGGLSQVVTATLNLTFGYVVEIIGISMTVTLDLIMSVEGTAHYIPDPALGGLTALGLGGAGLWLRRRARSQIRDARQ
jgi:hypothetical protein